MRAAVNYQSMGGTELMNMSDIDLNCRVTLKSPLLNKKLPKK